MNKRFASLRRFSDIVNTMIKGLEKRWVRIDMSSYGMYDYVGKSNRRVCFGCAATNTLCELMKKPFRPDNIADRTEVFNYDIEFGELRNFERAINSLRMGYVAETLRLLAPIEGLFSFSLPKTKDVMPTEDLPILVTETYKERLPAYKKYVKWLRKKGL